MKYNAMNIINFGFHHGMADGCSETLKGLSGTVKMELVALLSTSIVNKEEVAGSEMSDEYNKTRKETFCVSQNMLPPKSTHPMKSLFRTLAQPIFLFIIGKKSFF